MARRSRSGGPDQQFDRVLQEFVLAQRMCDGGQAFLTTEICRDLSARDRDAATPVAALINKSHSLGLRRYHDLTESRFAGGCSNPLVQPRRNVWGR